MVNHGYDLYETTKFRDFRDMVEQAARRFPDRVALSYKEDPQAAAVTSHTYRECRDMVRALGTELVARGCREQHVALVGDASLAWVLSYFALMAIGAVIVPIDRDLPQKDMADILRSGECRHLIFSASIEDKIEAVLPRIDPLQNIISMGPTDRLDAADWSDLITAGKAKLAGGDRAYDDYKIDTKRLATIVFTSGTTGQGKGVMLSQENICLDMINGMYLFAVTSKTINFLPPHHTFGSTVIFLGHYAQGVTIYLSSGLRYVASEIAEQKPTHLVLVPLFLEKLHAKIWAGAEKKGKDKMLRRMIRISNGLRKLGIDLRRKLFGSVLEPLGGRLEMVISGGAPLQQEVIDTFDGIGVTILNGYGITECAPLVTCNRNKMQKPGSVGVPILHEEVKIHEPNDVGEGEICVKGPNVMLGYYKDPEATQAAFDAEGFFRTGDLGRLDEDGWLYVTGRLKNLILLSNGKNVYPEEIEMEVATIAGVQEVVVYAGESRSNRKKEAIVAEVFPDREWLAEQGIEDEKRYFEGKVKELNSRMVSYKAVNLIKLRDEEFVKTTSRKIRRHVIDKTIE